VRGLPVRIWFAVFLTVVIGLSFALPWGPGALSLAAVRLRLPGPDPAPLPVDAAIEPCDQACREARLDSKRTAEAARRKAQADNSRSCWSMGLGCIESHFETADTAGPWVSIGMVEDLQYGLGMDSESGDRVSYWMSLSCTSRARAHFKAGITLGGKHFGPAEVSRELVNGSKVTQHGHQAGMMVPVLVMAYRWIRHDHYLVQTGSVLLPGSRAGIRLPQLWVKASAMKMATASMTNVAALSASNAPPTGVCGVSPTLPPVSQIILRMN
jgi:hypothetical protein